MIREMAYKTIHNDMIREIKTNKKAIKIALFTVLYRFYHFNSIGINIFIVLYRNER